LSKIEAIIKNIASFVAVGNLAVNELMECEATTIIIVKVTFMKKSKWTMVMTKNMREVVSQAVETLANMPK
jgi:hypothetical protein